MEEIYHDHTSDFLQNEKFDFGLAFSPNKNEDQLNKSGKADDEEVFFGPISFTEQCVATRAKNLQEEEKIKPLSPITGEQVVEIFKEATKVALHLEKLSSAKSPVSSTSSSKNSLSTSILKLSSYSSTGSESPGWLTGPFSNHSSEGMDLNWPDLDKENILPLRKASNENQQISENKNEDIFQARFEKEKIIHNTDEKIGHSDENSNSPKKGEQHLVVLKEQQNSNNIEVNACIGEQKGDICEQNLNVLANNKQLNITENEHVPGMLAETTSSNEIEQEDNKKVLKAEREVVKKVTGGNKKIPAVKTRGSGLPRPGLRTSRLPKSKNTDKSLSAFNSPIRPTGSSKKRDSAAKNDQLKKANSVEKTGGNKSCSKLQNSVPSKLPAQATTKDNLKSKQTLAKRKIFNSSESLDKLGVKDCKSKLPVCEPSKKPGPRPRRRRSSSLSSLDSSQSSASSQTSQDDNTTSKLTRPSTKIPTTKASLACSFGPTRRSKLQDTTADKKPQPLKALPRPGFALSTKNNKTDAPKPTKTMPPPPPPPTETESKDDKIPMPATPRSSSSLPVARRRSSFKSSLSSTSSREGSPTKYCTPRKQGEKITAQKSSTFKRRSNPTPSRSNNAPSSVSRRAIRSSGDDSTLLSLSPALKPKSTRKANRKLIPDKEPSLADGKLIPDKEPSLADGKLIPDKEPPLTEKCCVSSQTVDDLLDCDKTESLLSDVIPIQPKPIPQADLIDLSGL